MYTYDSVRFCERIVMGKFTLVLVTMHKTPHYVTHIYIILCSEHVNNHFYSNVVVIQGRRRRSGWGGYGHFTASLCLSRRRGGTCAALPSLYLTGSHRALTLARGCGYARMWLREDVATRDYNTRYARTAYAFMLDQVLFCFIRLDLTRRNLK